MSIRKFVAGAAIATALVASFAAPVQTAHADEFANDIIGNYDTERCEGTFMLKKKVTSAPVVVEALIDYAVGDVGVESVMGADPRLNFEIHPGYTARVIVEAVAGGKVVAQREFYLSCDVKPGADIYVTPGYHDVNGRLWHTVCEPYSQTERCRTEIWATQSSLQGGKVVTETGWVFNNLTYKPSARSLWKSNPLGNNGEWTAVDGRHWRTECDTAKTGRNGCRSYTYNLVVRANGSVGMEWVFNNMVRFS